MATKRPFEVVVRAYNVGFGDCLLVGFKYPPKASPETRWLLIDFGTTALASSKASLERIATDIAEATGSKLHVVVATHRHADHISGFAGKPGAIIRGLAPELVIQPWTEDPDAAPSAIRPTFAGVKGFVAGLDRMHDVAAAIVREVPKERGVRSDSVRGRLGFLGEANLKNLPAVRGLQALPGRHVYAHYGKALSLSRLLPGVRARVLGPPTLAQSKLIEDQRTRDDSEFWHFQAAAGAMSALAKSPFSSRWRARGGQLPFEARWFRTRLDSVRRQQLLGVVRRLDDAMNNTSLILLLQVGGTKLLFPGDAQLENWMWALRDAPEAASNVRLLRDLKLYKVGHHGSLNATPKTLLWEKLERRGAGEDRLRTVLSTKVGKHGSTAEKTEVPRRTLLDALRAETELANTEDLPAPKKKADLYVEHVLPL